MSNQTSIIRRGIKYLSPYRFLFIICILFESAITFLNIFQLHLLRIAIDIYVLKGNFLGLVKDVGLFYLLALVLLLLFNFLKGYFSCYIEQNVMLDLRMRVFAHLQRIPLSFFDKNPVGNLMTIAINDVRHLQPVATGGLTNLLGTVFLFLGVAGYLFYQNHQLTLMICILILVFAFLFKLINLGITKATRETRSWFGKINSFLQENITGVTLIRLFCREKEQIAKLGYLNNNYADASIRSRLHLNLISPTTVLSKATVMCFILWFGGKEVLTGTLGVGALLVFIGSMGLLFSAAERAIDSNKILQTARASLERIFGLLDIGEEEVKELQTKVKLPEFKEKIEFKNVWFAYDNNNFVLKNLNLEIRKGEQIAIVGHTGAGKTSIASILTRLYEINKGKILIDGIDIQNIQKSQLRSLIGVVSQHPFLFSGSIEDNIRLRNLEIDSQQVQEAASYIGADKFINRLTHGYKENVQELGLRLSTGQKQLISFARAYLFNPQILVLDEATANVDPGTVVKIKDALKRIKGKKTSIVIAHHLSTVRNADKIIVMHMGEIREIGTHSQLMKKKGIYYTLYLLQGIEDTLTNITRLVIILTEIVGYARPHYVRNAQLARKVGERLNLSEKRLDRLEIAALIYDVGKIRIPFDILTKPASLTDNEFEIIKTHVTYSKSLAEKIEDFDDIATIVGYHHERWDGKGYLEGLKGEAIPPESRIIAIVDAYQAMVTDKPYRQALSMEEAKKELVKNAGTQFDPQIIDIFIQVLSEERAKVGRYLA